VSRARAPTNDRWSAQTEYGHVEGPSSRNRTRDQYGGTSVSRPAWQSGSQSPSRYSRAEESSYMYDKVLFLDVDGVLHRDVPEHEEDLFLPGCMQQLRLIIERTGAQIVLSSSWRGCPKSRSEVSLQLSKYGIPNFVACTRDGGDEYARNEDILDFVARNPCRNWVAIDDYQLYELGGHYIQTNPDYGLTSSEAQHAIRVLNR